VSVSIHVANVVKKYGQATIIPDLSVDIENGEFFTLLGPSGCGKTTLLRMIAGFNSIEGGTISFDDLVINAIPAHKRNIGMVFQNYAIFPHLTVRRNVEYGLQFRDLAKDEALRRVEEILKTVRIEEYQDRLPERLSGGQQQRVALARAIVVHPSVLLMDEPLSNLDAKLRVEMRGAIRDIQKKVGITTVYVTHDQEEALCISDRIAVMREGVIQQTDAPQVIYSRPVNTFVASFIGHSNLFKATLADQQLCFCADYAVNMGGAVRQDARAGAVVAGVRPEEFALSASGQGLAARVVKTTFLGRYVNYELAFADAGLLPDQAAIEFSQDIGTAKKLYAPGETIRLEVNPEKINVFTEAGESLMQGAHR
jgi:iron(III) transport system ATP-binding protein